MRGKILHSSKLRLLPTILFLSLNMFPGPAYAATTLLPEADEDFGDYLDTLKGEEVVAFCSGAVDAWTAEYAEKSYYGLPETLSVEGYDFNSNDMLVCALKSGNMAFWMIPFFINNILEFIIGLAGLITVLMILVGAYYYIGGGVTDDKEKGKTIIKYALGGFVLVLSSWVLVNVLLLVLTA